MLASKLGVSSGVWEDGRRREKFVLFFPVVERYGERSVTSVLTSVRLDDIRAAPLPLTLGEHVRKIVTRFNFVFTVV